MIFFSRHDFLSNAPFDRFSLAMYPSDPFFLKALFLRGPTAGSGRVWPISAQGCVGKEPVVTATLSAMDFSNRGAIERSGKGSVTGGPRPSVVGGTVALPLRD